MKKFAINDRRLQERIEQLSEIGRISETGVCRLALSAQDREGVELVAQWMREAGLVTKVDAFGNLVGRWEGDEASTAAAGKPAVMIGSHVDTQPYAGRFDGTLGVLGAIEAVQTMREQGIVPGIPVVIASFSDEEGCRFNKGLFGVRGMLGKLEDGELERTDKNGVTRREALLSFGGNPERFVEDRIHAEDVKCYLELHIEQGPVLENEGHPVGIVTGISGPIWWTVDMQGFAGHAGSVPMTMRRDALAGAARVVTGLQALASQDPGAPTVGTVGSLQVFPDSRNIIPERVRFTVDLRDIDLARRNERERELRSLVHAAAEENGLSYEIRVDTISDPRYCAEGLKRIIREEARLLGLLPPELMSGPFHDAMVMSEVCDYAMIFVRCKDGISHNPAEFASQEDMAWGTEVLYRTLIRLCVEDESRVE